MSFSLVLGLALVLFCAGVAGFFLRKDFITMLLSAELMLNAANLALVAFSSLKNSLSAEAAVLMILTVAAAEAAVGLAVVVLLMRRGKLPVENEIREMRG